MRNETVRDVMNEFSKGSILLSMTLHTRLLFITLGEFTSF